MPDDWQPRFAQPEGLRWDNLEGGEEWLAGPRPQRRDGLHWLDLAEDDGVTIWMAGDSALRIKGEAGAPLATGDLSIWASNGSGLFREVPLRSLAPDGLLLPPVSEEAGILRLRRNRPADEDARIALFVSRPVQPPGPLAYRERIEPPLEETELVSGRMRESMRFYHLPAGRATEVEVSGPQRLRIDARMIYPEGDAAASAIFRLLPKLDDAPLPPLAFVTGPEIRYPLKRNGERVAAGRLESGYLQIPPGDHRLSLSADRDLYLQLLGQTPNDYLLSRLNAPEEWHEAFEEVPEDGQGPSALAREAGVQARDTRRQPAGLIAVEALKRNEKRLPQLRDEREALVGRHLFWRHLPPQTPGGALAYRYFPTPRLLRPGEARVTDLDPRHDRDYLKGLPRGRFHPFEHGKGLDYRLPRRFGPSMLRLAVDLSGLQRPVEWVLELEGLPAQRLLLDPQARVEAQRLQLDPRQLALTRSTPSAPARIDQAIDQSIEGPINTQADARFPGPPAPLIPVAWLEIPLPEEPDRLRLHSLYPGSPPLSIAVHYLAADPFALDEEQLAALFEHGNREDAWRHFRDLLASEARDTRPEGLDEALELLVDSWLPKLRKIDNRARRFAAGVGGEILPFDPPCSARARRSLENRAEHSASHGDGVSEAEALARLARCSRDQRREPYLLRLADRLFDLSEAYLAERMLRAAVIRGDASLSRAAAERLGRHYREEEDWGLLEALLAYRLKTRPGAESLANLIEFLAVTGDYRDALELALLLPDATLPREALLGAALNQEWWRLFDRLSLALPEPRRALWLGRKAERLGRIEQALAHYRSQDATEHHQAQARLMGALDIRRRLAAERPQDRVEAVKDWAQWVDGAPQAEHDIDHEILSSAGFRALFNPEFASHLTRPLAEPDAPLVFEVMGPTRLHIGVRPLHAPDRVDGIDDWLLVEGAAGGDLVRRPIGGNLPSPALEMPGDERGIGIEESFELSVEAGIHRISLRLMQHPALVTLTRERPALPSGVLPRLTPETARSLILPGEATHGHAEIERTGEDWLDYLVRPLQRILGMEMAAPDSECRARESGQDFAEARVPSPAAREDGTRCANRGMVPDWPYSPRITANAEITRSLSAPCLLAGCLAEGREARRRPEQQMIDLLWRIEQGETLDQAMLAAADALVNQHPELHPLWTRAVRGAEWRELDAFEGGGGIHRVELTEWRPVSPGLRLRKALMPVSADATRTLISGQTLGLNYFAAQDMILSIALRSRSLPFLASSPFPIRYRVDGESWQTRTLMQGQRTDLVLDLPAGGRHLQFSTEQVPVNHVVELRLPGSEEESVASRTYQVASVDAPLVLPLEGPASLRIERRTRERTTTETRTLGPGVHRLHLAPARGDALYRVFRHVPGERTPPPPPLSYTALGSRLAEPPPLSSRPLAAAYGVDDGLALGGQEDGTWGADLRLRQGSFGDDDEEGASDDEYLELGVSYREHPLNSRSWLKGRLFARLRDGGDTLGARFDYRRDLDQAPFSFNAETYALAQTLADETAWILGGAAALSARRPLGPKGFHLPAISLFARYLGADSPGNGLEAVDIDVYSDYKKGHWMGYKLSDTLVYRPWRDSEWRASLGMTGNPDLTPDRIDGRLEWRQMLGEGQLDLSWGHTRYLEDGDRATGSSASRFGLDASWEHWRHNGNRLELGAGWRYDVDSGDSTWLLTLEWNLSKGRGARDFRPGERDFQTLRPPPPQPLNLLRRD